MAKKNKKKFKISREDLNVKINEYLEKGGKITKLECIIPERARISWAIFFCGYRWQGLKLILLV